MKSEPTDERDELLTTLAPVRSARAGGMRLWRERGEHMLWWGATYFGQFQLWPGLSSTLANFYFGQFLLWPVLLWPILGQQENSKKKPKKTMLKQKSEKKHRENNTIRDGTNNTVRFLGENVAGRRPATFSQKHGLCPPFGFQQAFM